MMQVLRKIKVIFLSKMRNSGFELWERAIKVSLCSGLVSDGKVFVFPLPSYQL